MGKWLIAIIVCGCASRGDAREVRATPPPVVQDDGETTAAVPPPAPSASPEPGPATAERPPAEPAGSADAPTQPMTPNYYFRIVELTETQGASQLVIAIGERTGMSTSWRGSVVDAARRPVPGGELTIIQVRATTATARCKLPVRAITGHYRDVRLEPP